MSELPAELVCTDKDPNWLDYRQELITASDVSCLFGANPWKTRDELLAEKINREVVDLSTNQACLWGKEMETPNAEAFAKITGASVRLSGGLFKIRGGVPLGATLDGLTQPPRALNELASCWVSGKRWLARFWSEFIPLQGKTGVLEMKNTSERMKSKWTTPPDNYWMQVQAQMAVTELPYGVLCAKVGSKDMRFHVIMRDDLFIEELLESVSAFWQEVKNGRNEE